MGLIQQFYCNIAIYKQKRHENSSQWERTKIKRIEKFLRSCETQGIKDLKQIKQKNYDTFIQGISESKSPETIRQYALAIAEFAARAHLPIRISAGKSKNKKILKKANRILNLIREKINIDVDSVKDLREELLEIL